MDLYAQVFAWGNNAMGQCGQGHSTSPVVRPRRVLGLEGVKIHQISAGTSHSVVWTSLPTDRWVKHVHIGSKNGFPDTNLSRIQDCNSQLFNLR